MPQSRLLTWLTALAFLLLAHTSSAFPLSRRAGLRPTLSGGPSIMGSGTYPRANKLNDGSLIGTFTSFESGQTVITIVRSTNSGGSWTKIGEASRADTATHDTDNPYILQLPSGRVLVAFRNHDRTAAGVYTFFRITICASSDNGATWSFLSTPASDPGPVNGNWEPFLRIATDGSLQLYYSRENSGADQDNLMRTSTDGGASWTSATTVSGSGTNNARDGMVGVASTNGGASLLAVFETETNGGQFTIGAVSSNDDGRSWGNRRTIFTPSAGNANANAPQVVNVGGTMVVSVQTDEDSPGSVAAKVITSGDGGGSWGDKVTFSGSVSHWPGLVDLDSGSLLGLADDGGAKAQRITLS
ncbi:MAG: hypothetical protein Q9227_007485 [Pyrenula ochraceoflavens]